MSKLIRTLPSYVQKNLIYFSIASKLSTDEKTELLKIVPSTFWKTVVFILYQLKFNRFKCRHEDLNIIQKHGLVLNKKILYSDTKIPILKKFFLKNFSVLDIAISCATKHLLRKK